MDTLNAYDMLILPFLQYTAGVFATFSLIHGAQAGLDRLLGQRARREPGSFEHVKAHPGDDCLAGSRFDRTQAVAAGKSR